jgi:acetyltransferase-like isoleucine patch superfamily enzyme
MGNKIHPLSDVQSKNIGDQTEIWQYAIVLPNAVIGSHCNINCHTFIENDVIIGHNVTIKSGVYIWDGIRIEDDVFIGPSVVFTNDLRPRSKRRTAFPLTIVRKGASLGANCTVLAGLEIGAYSMCGAGSVLTKDVPPYSLVYGNPATIKGWVDKEGRKLQPAGGELWQGYEGEMYRVAGNQLTRL